MKKFILKIITMMSAAILTMGAGIGLLVTNQNAYQEAAAAESIAYTINFAYNASGSDSTTAYTTSTFLSNAFASGSEYVGSVSSTTACFKGSSTDAGMKFGSNSSKGSFALSLSSAGQVAATKIVVNAKSFGTDKTSITINSSSSQTLTSSYADYTFTLDGSTLSSISFSGNTKKRRGYISSISVYTNASTAALSSIAATSQPTKTTYKVGESFDPTGMVITAYYADSSSHAISDYTYSPDGALTVSDTAITITYVEGEVTKTTTVTISIITLSSISISGDMTTKAYNVGNSWNYSGLTVTALYSNASTEDVTSSVMWTADPSTATSVAITSVGLIATYDSKTASKTITGISVTTVSTIGGIVSGKQYLITATGSNGTTYILKAGAFTAGGSGTYSEAYTSLSNYSASDAWTFTTNETDNQWIISGSSGSTNFALHNTNTNNGVVSASSGSIAYEASYADETAGTIYLKDITNNRYLTVYSTNPDWRCYPSTTAQGVGSQLTLIEYSQKVVNYIAVTTMPTITSYDLSDALDTTGIVITATYSDSSSEEVTSGCTYSPTVLSTAGTQTITVTHTGSGKTTSFDVTVSSVSITSIAMTSFPYKTTYIQGNSLVTAGIVVTATYSNATTADVTSDCTYSPSSFTTAGTQTVTVTHTLSGLTTSFDVTVNSRPGYMFGENTDFASWSSAYAERVLTYTDFTMTFSNADKNTVTITDMPVSKGGNGIFASLSLPIKSITFGFTQWTTKTQTISLNKYKDGAIPEGDVATTLSFPADGTTITRTFSTVDVYDVEVSFSEADNQIGWEYVNVVFYDTTNATAFANNFLSSITCDGGLTPPSAANWATLASTYANDLTADDREILFNAIANESGSSIDQCVARYDFIIAKYGTATYTNFMSRTINQSSSLHGFLFSNYNTNTAILIVMSISLLSFTGLSLLLKKKGSVK